MILLHHFVYLIPFTYAYTYLPEDEVQSYTFNSNSNLHKYETNITEIPHHVLVVYSSMYCSGSLVGSRVVATAASCFHRRLADKVYVKVGSDMIIDNNGQMFPVLEVKLHEFYKFRSEMDNDIALLILKTNVVFGPGVQKVILVEPEVALRVGIGIEVPGWASTNILPKLLNRLIWSEMVVLNEEDCKRHYGGLVTRSNYCAMYTPDRILSDNGGGATYRHVLVGILSFGATNRVPPHVAVFTNVSYFHRWILKNTKRFLKKYCVEPKMEYSYEYYDYPPVTRN